MISEHAKLAEWTINHTYRMDDVKVQEIIQQAIDAALVETWSRFNLARTSGRPVLE